MRKFIFFFLLCCSVSTLKAQTPEKLPYQAVIRDASGNLLADQSIAVRFSIRQSTVNGAVLYEETMAITTTNIGVLNTEIGTGIATTGSMADIDWSKGPYFLEIAYDLSGGNNYVLIGTTQLISVPFSLHSKTTEGTVSKTKSERDNMSAPAVGQLLFCRDCGPEGELQLFNGSKWTNLIGEEVIE